MALVWIEEPPLGAPKSNMAKTLIRRQAMKQVAAERIEKGKRRREREDHARSLRSLVAASVDPEADPRYHDRLSSQCCEAQSPDIDNVSDSVEISDASLPLIRSTPSIQGMERIMLQYNVKLDKMTLFDAFDPSVVSPTPLLDDVPSLRTVLSRQRWDYLSMVGGMTRPPPYLMYATASLAETLHTHKSLEASAAASRPSAHLWKALSSLQEALNRPEAVETTEILCAIHILALVEIIRPTKRKAWSQHVSGAGLLIQSRGPARFKSELDMAMLLAFVSLTVPDRIYSNSTCFLEEPAWQAAMLSMAEYGGHPLGSQSRLVVRLQTLSCELPGFFADLRNIDCHTGRRSAEDLAAIVNWRRHTLLRCRHDFESILVDLHWCGLSCFPPHGTPGTVIIGFEILSMIVRCTVLLDRILERLEVVDAMVLDQETVQLRRYVLRVEDLLGAGRLQLEGFGIPQLESCIRNVKKQM